ncbi:hypothetical protein OH76DRAFT_1477589 [Lentinus brumalis]|uniref:REJ domain-containing protein n=1 Tax=Lentinus brumalis TaxID=2498619 RepID=A0A371DTQ9_9APHY|nr:hypothetical protein OH76DRAFT_1477589 [Polyporus brumalis]
MRCTYILTCLLLPLLAVAQSSTGAASGSTASPAQTSSGSGTQPSQTGSASGSQTSGGGNSTASATPSITVVTSVFTTVVLGSNRVLSTLTSTQLITSTIAPANSGTSGGSSGAPANTSTSSLPPPTTAPVSIDGGASIAGGAPSPGASGAGGVFGPDDGYTAAALAQHANLVLVAFTGVVAGAALVLM